MRHLDEDMMDMYIRTMGKSTGKDYLYLRDFFDDDDFAYNDYGFYEESNKEQNTSSLDSGYFGKLWMWIILVLLLLVIGASFLCLTLGNINKVGLNNTKEIKHNEQPTVQDKAILFTYA